MHGAELSLSWARAGSQRLRPGGRMLLYTGVAISGGRDVLKEALQRDAAALGCSLSYKEIDVDVFGDELDRPAYGQVERIAVVAAVLERQV